MFQGVNKRIRGRTHPMRSVSGRKEGFVSECRAANARLVPSFYQILVGSKIELAGAVVSASLTLMRGITRAIVGRGPNDRAVLRPVIVASAHLKDKGYHTVVQCRSELSGVCVRGAQLASSISTVYETEVLRHGQSRRVQGFRAQ